MRAEEVFSQKLLEIRTLRGLSQMALGETSGVGDMVVLRIEKGRQRVRLDQAVALAAALNVPLVQMLPPEAEGDHRRLLELPESIVAQLRLVHEATGAAIRLAGGGS